VSIGGNITIGNEPTDTIQFIAGIDSDIVPAQDSVYSLGTASLRWSNIFVNEVTVDDISISNNYITTTASNTNLELRANGTGSIVVPNNDVLINNELTVIGESTLGDVDVTGVLTVNGNVTQTGNYDIVGDVTINGSLTVSEYAQFEEIRIDDNFITTTTSNTNLELRANGTGVILVPNNNVQITNDLTVVANINANNLTTTGLVTADQFSTGDILIDNNVITTTLSNSDLELRANGTGDVVVPTNDVILGQDLTVNGDTDLDNTTIQGTVTHTGNVTQVGNISLTGDYDITGTVTISSTAQFENIRINNNVITTTDSNSDLELRAAGTGEVIVPNNDVVISNDLFVDGTITVGDINSAGTITANRFSTGDILIDDNFITTTALNSDLELRANGTGEVVVPNNNVIIEQDLTVNGDTDLEDTTVTGTITHTGAVTQTGNIDITGNFVTTGTVTVSATAQFENIQVSGNVITTTSSNSDLELRANGTGIVSIPNNDVVVANDLTVVGTFSAGNITSTGTIRANNFTTGDILIDDNFITTTTSNSNLELRANGTGSIVIDDFSINNATISSVSNFTIAPAGGSVIIDSTGAVKLPVGTIADRPTAVAGQIRFNSELARFEGYNGTNWIQLHGVVDVDGDTRVTAELTEGANDNTIRFIVQNNTVVDINSSRLTANRITVDAIEVDGNVISTTATDTDLVLTANGTGSVRFENFAFSDNRITKTVSGSNTILQTSGTGYFEFTDPYGVVLPVGDNTNRPPGVTGMIRYNNADKRVELYDGTTWVSVAGASSGISFAQAEDIAIEKVLIFG
jgi:cytoskeletal protein CcmA (bactofilin family)